MKKDKIMYKKYQLKQEYKRKQENKINFSYSNLVDNISKKIGAK